MSNNTQVGSVGRHQLVTQERGVDTHWYSGGVPRHGKFGNDVYSGWPTTENYVEEEFDFTPVSNAASNAYGGTIVFELDKRASRWIGVPNLLYTRDGISNTQDLANGVAFCDYEGCTSISEIRWIYGNRVFYQLTGQDILTDAMSNFHAEDRARFKELVLGGFTLAERQAMARESKNICVPLLVPWAALQKSIIAEGLPNKVRVEIDFRTYQNATTLNSGASYQDTAGPALSKIRYRQRFVHFKQLTRDNLFLLTRNPGKMIIHKIFTRERHLNESVSSGTSSVRIKIPNLKNNSYLMRIFIRKTSDLTNVNKTYTNFYLPYRVWLEDQGQPITNYVYPWKLAQIQNNGTMHPASSVLLPWTEINFCNAQWVEASDDACFGGRTLGKYNNPELIIDFAHGTTTPKWDTFQHFPNLMCTGQTGIAFDAVIDIETKIHNNILEGMGDIRKNLL
jgi:hypothetical protein